MNEPDDRLAGDLVWELFPNQEAPRRSFLRVAVWVLVVGSWLLSPSLSVVLVCLTVAYPDFESGRRLGRTIPDKAGGGICSLFSYAWGAWKLGITAFGLVFVVAMVGLAQGTIGDKRTPPYEAFTSMLLWFGGFLGSSLLTAAGLIKALRSGMRIWVGEGINQARTLLLGMLIVIFTCLVLGPMCVWLVGRFLNAGGDRGRDLATVLGFVGCMFVGPVVILVALDWMSKRVVADTPGKFGAKTPTVGKWDR